LQDIPIRIVTSVEALGTVQLSAVRETW
jgi:hypothetical protein